MAGNNKLPPLTLAALREIDKAFWREALRVVEEGILAEETPRKPIARLALTRPIRYPPYVVRRCSATSCGDMR